VRAAQRWQNSRTVIFIMAALFAGWALSALVPAMALARLFG